MYSEVDCRVNAYQNFEYILGKLANPEVLDVVILEGYSDATYSSFNPQAGLRNPNLSKECLSFIFDFCCGNDLSDYNCYNNYEETIDEEIESLEDCDRIELLKAIIEHPNVTQEISVNQLLNGEIDLDSLSDSEAIKLHEDVATYLVDNESKIETEAIEFSLVEDYLIPLWLRTYPIPFKYIFSIDFEDNEYMQDLDLIGVQEVIPFAYAVSFENFTGDSFFARIIDNSEPVNKLNEIKEEKQKTEEKKL